MSTALHTEHYTIVPAAETAYPNNVVAFPPRVPRYLRTIPRETVHSPLTAEAANILASIKLPEDVIAQVAHHAHQAGFDKKI